MTAASYPAGRVLVRKLRPREGKGPNKVTNGDTDLAMEQMAQCWLASLLKLSSLVHHEMCQCQAKTPPKE